MMNKLKTLIPTTDEESPPPPPTSTSTTKTTIKSKLSTSFATIKNPFQSPVDPPSPPPTVAAVALDKLKGAFEGVKTAIIPTFNAPRVTPPTANPKASHPLSQILSKPNAMLKRATDSPDTPVKTSPSIASFPQVETLSELPTCCPTLTRTQRLWGFAFCMGIGYLFSTLASLAFMAGTGTVTHFAVLYSLGNLISTFGTGFLVGPWKQVKSMWDPKRRVCCAVFLVTIVVILLLAFLAPQLGFVIFLLLVTQLGAYIWYSATYIPYGRTILTGTMKRITATAMGS